MKFEKLRYAFFNLNFDSISSIINVPIGKITVALKMSTNLFFLIFNGATSYNYITNLPLLRPTFSNCRPRPPSNYSISFWACRTDRTTATKSYRALLMLICINDTQYIINILLINHRLPVNPPRWGWSFSILFAFCLYCIVLFSSHQRVLSSQVPKFRNTIVHI